MEHLYDILVGGGNLLVLPTGGVVCHVVVVDLLNESVLFTTAFLQTPCPQCDCGAAAVYQGCTMTSICPEHTCLLQKAALLPREREGKAAGLQACCV